MRYVLAAFWLFATAQPVGGQQAEKVVNIKGWSGFPMFAWRGDSCLVGFTTAPGNRTGHVTAFRKTRHGWRPEAEPFLRAASGNQFAGEFLSFSDDGQWAMWPADLSFRKYWVVNTKVGRKRLVRTTGEVRSWLPGTHRWLEVETDDLGGYRGVAAYSVDTGKRTGYLPSAEGAFVAGAKGRGASVDFSPRAIVAVDPASQGANVENVHRLNRANGEIKTLALDIQGEVVQRISVSPDGRHIAWVVAGHVPAAQSDMAKRARPIRQQLWMGDLTSWAPRRVAQYVVPPGDNDARSGSGISPLLQWLPGGRALSFTEGDWIWVARAE